MKYKKILLIVSGILFSILSWYLIVLFYVASPEKAAFRDLLPQPTIVAFWEQLSYEYFYFSVLASLKRIGVGLSLAFIIGFPMGWAVGASPSIRIFFNYPFHFVRMISPLAWMPIAMLFMPTFEQTILFLISFACIWPILLNTAQGVMHINPEWVNMARIQGATSWQLIVHIIFPGIVPYILTGIRLALGVAWIVLVPAEFLGVNSGLGYMINNARDAMEYDRLMAGVLSIGAIGMSMDCLIQWIQSKYDWRLKNE